MPRAQCGPCPWGGSMLHCVCNVVVSVFREPFQHVSVGWSHLQWGCWDTQAWDWEGGMRTLSMSPFPSLLLQTVILPDSLSQVSYQTYYFPILIFSTSLYLHSSFYHFLSLLYLSICSSQGCSHFMRAFHTHISVQFWCPWWEAMPQNLFYVQKTPRCTSIDPRISSSHKYLRFPTAVYI